MEVYSESFTDGAGNALSGAVITVRDSDGNLASLYEKDGTTEKSNPFTTISDGLVQFAAANGKYEVTYQYALRSGRYTNTVPIVLFDGDENNFFSSNPYDTNKGVLWGDLFDQTLYGIGSAVETQELGSGDIAVTFSNSIVNAGFYLTGPGVDDKRLIEGVHFSADTVNKTLTLNESYPSGSKISMYYYVGDSGQTYSAVSGIIKVATLAALRAHPTWEGASIYMQEYAAGQGGGGLYKWTTGDFTAQVALYTLGGKYVASDSDPTGAGGAWVLQGNVLDPRQFGAKGTGGGDDAPAIQGAVDVCATTGSKVFPYKLKAINGTFNCSSKITITTPIDIDFSDNVNFTFDNVDSCGFFVDLSDSTNNYSLFEMHFGSLYSPALDGMTIPGFPGEQDTSSRTGIALQIRACDRANFKLMTAQGWDDVVHLSGSEADKTTENINIEVNTLDWNTRAFTFNTINTPLNAIDINVNTLGMAKHQLHFTDGGTGQKVSSLNFKCNGQTFIKEHDACVIYSDGDNILQDSTIFFNWVFAAAIAGYGETPPEVTVDELLPFIGGSEASNGLTTDGNSAVGYFTGTRNHITIGLPYGTPGNLGTFTGLRPAAGDPIRFKLAASSFIKTNKLVLKNSDFYQTGTPVALTTTLDESTFNGGTGAALIQNKAYCSATLGSDLTALSIAEFYLFHQNVNCGRNHSVKLYPYRGTLAGMYWYAETVDTTNRAVKVVLKNMTGATISAGTVFYFYVDFD